MRRAWALGLTVLCACGWFDPGRACKEGAWSCDGDQVQLCVPDATRSGPEGPATSWTTIQTCEDTPLSARMCAVVASRADCVDESSDGGVAEAESEGEAEW